MWLILSVNTLTREQPGEEMTADVPCSPPTRRRAKACKGQLHPFLPHTHSSWHRYFSQLYVCIGNQSLQHQADFCSNGNKPPKLKCTQQKTDTLCWNKEQQNHPGMNYNLSWQQHWGCRASIKMRWAMPIESGIPDMTDWCQTQLG